MQESEIILEQIQTKDEIIPVSEKSQAPNCTYLFLDTETNSLSADRVVLQLAWITTDSKGTVCSEKSFYLNRKVYIDPGASRVNGITNDTLKKNGTPPEVVFNEFIKDLSNAEMLVAHNFSFDIQALQNDFENFGFDISLLDKPYICTMAWSKEYVQAKNRSGALKNPRLEEMAGVLLYGDISRTFPEAHDALFDTKLTKECFFVLNNLNTKGLIKSNALDNNANRVTEKLNCKENVSISETAKVFTDNGIQYISDEELEAMDLSTIFEGKKVLITGNLFEIGLMVREEGNELIQYCGGLPQKSLVKSLDFVVIGADFGPAKMAQIIDRQKAGSSMKCLTPKQFDKIVSFKNPESQPPRAFSGKTPDRLSFELKTLQKYADFSKQAIQNGTASLNFTQQEFDYLKECKLLDDSMIKEKKDL